jgi:hypothetical protein
MTSPTAEGMRAKIREAIVVEQFYEPPARAPFGADGSRSLVPMTELIADAERRLGVPFPPWLREVYECCNGFATHTGECILYPIHGSEGVTEFNLFLREMEWAPSWLPRAIVFGYTGGSGSITTHTVARDGELVEWTYIDGENVHRPSGDLFAVWRRVQAEWAAVIAEADCKEQGSH